jgi:hypothetical protein
MAARDWIAVARSTSACLRARVSEFVNDINGSWKLGCARE